MDKRVAVLYISVFLYCFLSQHDLLSLEITITTPTANFNIAVESKEYDGKPYLNLSNVLSGFGLSLSVSENVISFTKENTRVEMNLNSTYLTTTRDNITKLLQLSYPLKVDQNAIWIEFTDLVRILKDSLGYQVYSRELSLASASQIGEFAEIFVPPSVSKKNETRNSKDTSSNDLKKSNCWRNILIIPGHSFLGDGINLSEKCKERDINEKLSREFLEEIKSLEVNVKLASSNTESKIEHIKRYINQEKPDIILSIHIGYPTSDTASANIFYSRTGDLEKDQLIVEFIDRLVENTQRLESYPVPKVYLSPLIFSSMLGISEVLIEFFPKSIPTSDKYILEDTVNYKPYLELIVSSLRQFLTEKCK
ncbi:MAG: N-acetylmuramoyl-L-alanine amidase [Candidatus Hydrogenedentes bacterium]|nr:N-acetylmuramoyl-L-alanine amidase [Candidatus Hydrogenedentota bacterium]